MQKRTARSSHSAPLIESLETRTHLCAGTAAVAPMATSVTPAVQRAIIAPAKVAKEITHTALKVVAGPLGTGATFTVSVKTAVAFGAPTGTVEILDHGNVFQTITLTPGTSTNPKFAVSEGTYVFPSGAGDAAYSIGAHHLTATYTPTGTFLASKIASSFSVKAPKYARQHDGLKVASVVAGSGAGIAAGQTATMMYTGYLAKNGSIFDDSSAHSPGTFSFTVEGSPEQVIPGFDEGTVGMEVGETRVLAIPSKLGYGPQGSSPSIPPNANLVFMITLVSIS